MRKWLQIDRWGIGLSLACAVHCLAIPFLFGLLPSLALALHSFEAPMRPLALWLWRAQGYDRWLVLGAIVLASASLIAGWRRHRRALPLLWLVAGSAGFAFGLASPRHWSSLHGPALAAGGICVAVAHWLNLRLRR